MTAAISRIVPLVSPPPFLPACRDDEMKDNGLSEGR